ncbi:class I adenylate-forming enzyme family protein [Rhodococcus opacus]|jgi:fatty-acyl-CoA synthase|uniref:class I adenylate-forming enzyme family protein n=1 Tax=Rhodococcus opacus TaxID=37919 RepID=UPI002475A8F3|nr:AMP-binding protein [Rhodococcus opacus]MDH6286459.1 fatty-acyl-CoA synthase [Rhodococcus opacus]
MNVPTVATPDQRRAALERAFAPWRPRTFDEQFDHAVAKYASRPYVISGDRIFTYADVQARARRLADGLAALGVRPGDHVGLIMANYPEYAPIKLAIARVGAVAVPLNYLYRTQELGYVLAQSCCRVLITMTSFRDMDYQSMLDDLAPGWERVGKTALGDLEFVITFAPDGADERREGALDLTDLERIGAESPGSAPGGLRRPDDPSDILYTSGTTGQPKGVMLSHDGLHRAAYGSLHCRALPDGNRVVFALPCYHLFAYGQAVLASIFVGGAMLPQPKFDPLEYFTAIERHRVTDVLAVPTMSVALVEHPERNRFDLSSLRMMLSAAAVAPTWLWQRIRDELGVAELVTAYGMTEMSGTMTMTRPEDPFEAITSTVGRPLPSGAAGLSRMNGVIAEYRVIDPVTGNEVPREEVGELIARGPTTMKRYWNRPEDTAAMLRDGWMHSGDLVRFQADGSMVIAGRTKDLIKTGGELVMPKEVEDFLTGRPGVSQAYVVGIPDERWGEVVGAFIVPEPNATVSVEDLSAVCRAELSRFKVPRHIFLMDSGQIPQTPTGKVQKFKLVPTAQRLIGSHTPLGITASSITQGE